MTPEQLTALLEDVQNHAADAIELRQGAVVYDQSLPRRWPQISWNRLLAIYGDHPGDWAAITAEYLALAAKDPPEDDAEPAPTKPDVPLKVIGEAHDMFNGQLRPVFNRDPLPAEIPPAADPEPTLPTSPPEPQHELVPEPAVARPAPPNRDYIQELAHVCGAIFANAETWKASSISQINPAAKGPVTAARDSISAAVGALNQLITHPEPEFNYPLQQELVAGINAAKAHTAQAITAVNQTDQEPTPGNARQRQRITYAALRDLQSLEILSAAAEAALAYWQGRRDANRYN